MKLMLIGGGEIGKGNSSYETLDIDKEIVKMCGKENPNVLFIGLASSFADSYYDYVKKIFKDLNCNPVYLKKKNVTKNPDIVKNKIESADIIYIGGGDTIKLKDTVLEYGIDKLLYDAACRGCVIAGISAGAILLAKSGFSDSYILRGESDKYQFIDGLGLADLCICPHYSSNLLKQNELKDTLQTLDYKVYGIDDCCALKIVDGEISVIKSKNDANAYLCEYDDEYIESVI